MQANTQTQPPTPVYGRLIHIGRGAVVCFGVSVAIQWIIHVIDWVEWSAIRSRTVSGWVAPLEEVLGRLVSGSRLVWFVLFLTWIHRMVTNTVALGRKGMTVTPGNAVVWFIIPVANFYKPFKIVRELAACSSPSRSKLTPPRLVATWWVLLLTGNLLNLSASALRTLKVIDLDAFMPLAVAATSLATGAAIATYFLIRSIDANQERLRRRALRKAARAQAQPPV